MGEVMKKPCSLAEKKRMLTREVILDAAVGLLESEGGRDFSMRELAEEAGVSFATVFNHFGSKGGILSELTLKMLADIKRRFEGIKPGENAIECVLQMASIGSEVCIERSAVYRRSTGFVMFVERGNQLEFRSVCRELWELALVDCRGILPSRVDLVKSIIPEQLAVMFRGVVALWVSGEVSDEQFQPMIEIGASTIMLCIVEPNQQEMLIRQMLKKQASHF